jgi:hypothetical protein
MREEGHQDLCNRKKKSFRATKAGCVSWYCANQVESLLLFPEAVEGKETQQRKPVEEMGNITRDQESAPCQVLLMKRDDLFIQKQNTKTPPTYSKLRK